MPFASGGVISSPTMFPMRGGMGLMGEAGPEAIMPLRRGPDGRLGVEGGGSTTNVTYNVAAGVTRNELISALQVMQQSIESRMIGIMRRQGVA
jgi:phage-related minor tail protein